jgi:type IV secretion system protein VirD4
VLITQDIRQVVDAYGNRHRLNCHVRIAFRPNQFETAELLSKMTGTTTVQKASYLQRFATLGHGAHQRQRGPHRRPLMTPDECSALNPPQKRGDGAQERIVAPGQMLIFVSGHHPILRPGLCLLDPVLNSQTSPAEQFHAWRMASRSAVAESDTVM